MMLTPSLLYVPDSARKYRTWHEICQRLETVQILFVSYTLNTLRKQNECFDRMLYSVWVAQPERL